jgi:hypothetical protein
VTAEPVPVPVPATVAGGLLVPPDGAGIPFVPG